ncbi:hypothetical protein OPT61_g3164 [Boeremia exigua]|uniref:Uncharacterized protein n=1 Tax=Boeremia exigua TaxID=749465 RepID=A0ACC2IIU6_9PLEO|nr:hypothetical protein OPT61_g3164 [Boeremia exigua]
MGHSALHHLQGAPPPHWLVQGGRPAPGLEWLKHFNAHTKERTVGTHRLLVINGHKSHNLLQFQEPKRGVLGHNRSGFGMGLAKVIDSPVDRLARGRWAYNHIKKYPEPGKGDKKYKVNRTKTMETKKDSAWFIE